MNVALLVSRTNIGLYHFLFAAKAAAYEGQNEVAFAGYRVA